MAQIVKGYLASAASLAYGIPATLPILVMDEVKEIPRPALVIAAKEDKRSSGGRRVISVTPILATWQKSAETDAPPNTQQTTREEAATWQRLIDDRMRDTEAFGVYLASLEAGTLDGVSFLALPRFDGAAVPMRDGESQACSYATTITFHLLISRITAA